MNEQLIVDYKNFLNNGKTERECVEQIVKMAQKHGYKDISKVKNLKPGDKVYITKMDKAIALFEIGFEPIEKGMNILCAHIDSPRLDAKQNPLYEKDCITYMNTHYYGGIKKYQWTTIPLAIHGVVVKKDGKTVKVVIGENQDEPVFCISDILPHLAQEQMNENFKALGLGINVTTVQFQNVVPPVEVQAAFEDVNKASQDMKRLINEGKEEYNKEIPKAQGEADRQIQVAEGYASERVNMAKGDVARFNAVYEEYKRAPAATKERIYLETMAEIFGSEKKPELIDSELENLVPVKNLKD